MLDRSAHHSNDAIHVSFTARSCKPQQAVAGQSSKAEEEITTTMVVVRDFEVRLVEAQSKNPFPEHIGGNGDVYVEVEPGVEYYVAIRRVRNATNAIHGCALSNLCCEFVVDGESLGYITKFRGNQLDAAFTYNGLAHLLNGVTSNQSLLLLKPKLGCNETAFQGQTVGRGQILGIVEICVFQAIARGFQVREDFRSGLEAKEVVFSGRTKEKTLRSVPGYHTQLSSDLQGNTPVERFERGNFQYVITLHYCTTPGLITAGILPPFPPPPAPIGSSDRTVDRKRKAPVRNTFPAKVPSFSPDTMPSFTADELPPDDTSSLSSEVAQPSRRREVRSDGIDLTEWSWSDEEWD